jgi:hypothetical protein
MEKYAGYDGNPAEYTAAVSRGTDDYSTASDPIDQGRSVHDAGRYGR